MPSDASITPNSTRDVTVTFVSAWHCIFPFANDPVVVHCNDDCRRNVRCCCSSLYRRFDRIWCSSKPVQATRASTTVIPLPESAPNFLIQKSNKSYKYQYSNIYFLRLQSLRRSVEEAALEKWKNFSEKPVMIPRVLDVVKSQLCFIIGTVYLHMPLKPNVMIDIARDVRSSVHVQTLALIQGASTALDTTSTSTSKNLF
jgi:hypothetical protein